MSFPQQFARRPLPLEEYQVGWICPLSKELTAARAILDEEHGPYKSPTSRDDNSYVLGQCWGHNVVIACLPLGKYGTNSAAMVASKMRMTFDGILFGLVIGIGGGIPNLSKGVDIRLGDVVVSQPDGTHGGVVQYDLRKNLGNSRFERKGSLRPPPTVLLTALASLQSEHRLYGHRILQAFSTVEQRFPALAKQGYTHPGVDNDILYCENVLGHTVSSGENTSCTQCRDKIVIRKPRENNSPQIHYGTIVSGNELMKNATVRDQLGQEFNAKCIEMEAAGLMDELPCVVIRGICDYADSHKNDAWQEYAALAAAGFAKELMASIRNVLVRGAHTRNNLSLSDETSMTNARTRNIETMANANTGAQAILAKLDFANSDSKRAQLSLHEIGPECFRWIESTDFFTWLRDSDSPTFLVVGKPASGKSTLMRYLSDERRVKDRLCSNGRPWTVVHYFFDFRGGSSPANDPAGMIRLFIRQLISSGKLTTSPDEATIRHLTTSDVRHCVDIFSDLISGSETQICAFIDGLDEYQGNLWELCKILENLRHRTGIKMCLASRPEPEVLKAGKDWPSLVMQAHNRQSMLLYIQNRIDQVTTSRFVLERCFTQSLREQLVANAEGVILWVKLALKELLQVCEKQPTSHDLAGSLASLEPDLTIVYDHILERIPQQFKHDAALVLLLLSEAPTRWTTSDKTLLQAIEFIQRRHGLHKFLGSTFEADDMKRMMTVFLPNLIEVSSGKEGLKSNDQAGNIRLIHFSLAAHLRKTSWLLIHLQPAIGGKYYGNVWKVLVIEVLKTARFEGPLHPSDIRDWWDGLEITMAQWRISRHYQDRFKDPDVNRHNKSIQIPKVIQLAKRVEEVGSLSMPWLQFRQLLDHALQYAPDLLISETNLALEEVYSCISEMLNWSYMSFHLPRCGGLCRHVLDRRKLSRQLYRLIYEDKLDIALAIMHQKARYVQISLKTRALSSNDRKTLLDLTLLVSDGMQSPVPMTHIVSSLCGSIQSHDENSALDETPLSISEMLDKTVKNISREEFTSEYFELLSRHTIMKVNRSHAFRPARSHCDLCTLVNDVEDGQNNQHESFVNVTVPWYYRTSGVLGIIGGWGFPSSSPS